MGADQDRQLQVRIAVLMLFMSAMGSVGGWMLNTHAETFDQLVTVQHIGGLLMQLSAVVLAWFTKNPMNLQGWDPSKPDRRGDPETKEKP